MSALPGQGIYTAIGQQISLPLVQSQVGLWPIASIQIDNGTAATLQIQSPSGGPIANVRAYQFRTFPLPNLDGFRIVNQGGQTIQDSDMLTVVWSEAGTGPFVGSYGLEGDTFYRVIDIALTGGIYQGTGTFDDPVTGLKLFRNSAGYGELDFYVDGQVTISINQEGLTFDLFPIDQAGVTWDSTSFRGYGLTLTGTELIIAQGGVTWDGQKMTTTNGAVVIDATGISIVQGGATIDGDGISGPGVTIDATGLTITEMSASQAGVTWDSTNLRAGQDAVRLDASGLKTYNGTTLECQVGTDGAISAGAGNVKLNSSGLSIQQAPGGQATPVSALTFLQSATQVGDLSSWSSAAGNFLSLESLGAGIPATLEITARGGTTGQLSLSAFGGTSDGNVIVQANNAATKSTIEIDPTTITMTIGGAKVLNFTVNATVFHNLFQIFNGTVSKYLQVDSSSNLNVLSNAGAVIFQVSDAGAVNLVTSQGINWNDLGAAVFATSTALWLDGPSGRGIVLRTGVTEIASFDQNANFYLKAAGTAGAFAGYGKFYVLSDGSLNYVSPNGTVTKLANG